MRPKSVVQAERVYLASAALIVVGAVMDWGTLTALGGTALAIGTTAFFLGAFLLLILFATRRGSRIARALLVAVTVLSVGSMLWQIGSGQVALGLVGVLNTVQMLLEVVGTVLLFRPNAASWFARPDHGWEEEDEA